MRYLWHVGRCEIYRSEPAGGPVIHLVVVRYRLVERRDGVRYLRRDSGNPHFARLEDALAHIQRWVEEPEGEECLIWRTAQGVPAEAGEEQLRFRSRNRPDVADFDAALATQTAAERPRIPTKATPLYGVAFTREEESAEKT